jgi:oligopeptide transport system ATP-binding protein
MDDLLSVRNLSVQFQTQAGVARAIDDLSFTIGRGETLGIVGESGSGKSVTALAILGLVPSPPGIIASGEVLFHGKDLLKISDAEMRAIRGRRIAMIFQDPMSALNPVLTIGRQMIEAMRVHLNLDKRAAHKRAVELLDLVGIPSAARRLGEYPHQFSGGMAQRVMIAMALSCDPELLIADEPTTALDVTIQAQILDLINQIKRELGMAIILVTHDLGVVAGMADRVIVVYGGRVLEEGSTEAIFANPRVPYTIGLLRSVPRLDAAPGTRLVPIPGSPPDVIGLDRSCPFQPRCSYAVAGLCDRKTPDLVLVGSEHRAACFADVPSFISN